MSGFWSEVVAWLKRSKETSETKVTLIIALWVAMDAIVPGPPLTLPEMDFTSIGLGRIVLSPATLAVYVLGRVVTKAIADGEFPFQPSPKPAAAAPVSPGGSDA